jgi:hypothetical protein
LILWPSEEFLAGHDPYRRHEWESRGGAREATDHRRLDRTRRIPKHVELESWATGNDENHMSAVFKGFSYRPMTLTHLLLVVNDCTASPGLSALDNTVRTGRIVRQSGRTAKAVPYLSEQGRWIQHPTRDRYALLVSQLGQQRRSNR